MDWIGLVVGLAGFVSRQLRTNGEDQSYLHCGGFERENRYLYIHTYDVGNAE